MGIDDVLSFNEAIYRQRVSQMSDAELKQREWEKQCRFWTSSGSAGAGLGASVATGGLSLIFTAYSSRQAYVVTRKRWIIQDELRKRNIVLRKARWRDTPVAIGATLLGMSAGLGVDGLIGDDAGGLVTADVTGAEAGAGSGAVENVTTDQTATGPSDAFISAATEEDVADAFAALAVSQGASKIASEAFVDVIERLEDTNWQNEVRKALGCLRLAGSTHTSMWCNNCGSTISKGRYGRRSMPTVS
ncbi:uncharacterized protein Z518_03376 [Rhinocladiella mackenziei CBS 650.93]|uniref:Uncharacterized protein n=1 Tax=Rhinocladiella mackenziei CBS 650.93 TaxID=1442369 RepID=A0A0D2IRU9_9EURO|nr:uncharacterized protein Z518_03376 [Rhinocladiella mackenziei CBS 650.93]KIX08719.1 hypothetical protein Z518_03376 [Rhinocladiella mackenziei CBS 650.93]